MAFDPATKGRRGIVLKRAAGGTGRPDGKISSPTFTTELNFNVPEKPLKMRRVEPSSTILSNDPSSVAYVATRMPPQQGEAPRVTTVPDDGSVAFSHDSMDEGASTL
jgi:hypothetical protein